MTKKLVALALIILIVAVVLAKLPKKEEKQGSVVTTTKDQRLADPNLLFSYISGSGLCRNSKGEQGGCYSYTFLYKSGKYISESGWIGLENERETQPAVKKKLDQSSMDKIIREIRDTGIMEKSCPAKLIMDASFYYQINLDGTKRVFEASPPADCRDVLSKIDTLINSTAKSIN